MGCYTIAFKWNDWEKEIPRVWKDAEKDDVVKEAKEIVQKYAKNTPKATIIVRKMEKEGNEIVHSEEVDIESEI